MEKKESLAQDQELISRIARRVLDMLRQEEKRALVLFTGSTIGFDNTLESLKKLRSEGYRFWIYMTQSAQRLLDAQQIKDALSPVTMFHEQECIPEQIAEEFDTILVPSMTMNTAAKIAACIADTPATRLLNSSLMRGRRVIVAIDGCCPDHEVRKEKGFDMTAPLRAQLKQNIDQLEAYGAQLTTSQGLYQKTVKQEEAAGNGKEIKLAGKVISEEAIIANIKCSRIKVCHNALITQLAEEAARDHNVEIVKE